MGGIVARNHVVERQTELVTAQKQIGLFLVASPSLGSSYADWLAPLATFMGHAQASALRFVRGNEWLLDLDKEFTNLKEAGILSLRGKELVEDKFIVLATLLRRQVVEPFTGARYFGEPYKVPESDHFSIAKPKDRRAIQHRLLVQFVDLFIGNSPFSKDRHRLSESSDSASSANEDSERGAHHSLQQIASEIRGYLEVNRRVFRTFGPTALRERR